MAARGIMLSVSFILIKRILLSFIAHAIIRAPIYANVAELVYASA